MEVRMAAQLLGVDPSASDEEMKKAYKRAALKAHPDKKGGSKERFQRVADAYTLLIEAKKPQPAMSSPRAHTHANADELFAGLFGMMMQTVAPMMQEMMKGLDPDSPNGGSVVFQLDPHLVEAMFETAASGAGIDPRMRRVPGTNGSRGLDESQIPGTRAYAEARGPFGDCGELVRVSELRAALEDGFPVTLVDCRSFAEKAENGEFPGRVRIRGVGDATVVDLPCDRILDSSGNLRTLPDCSRKIKDATRIIGGYASQKKHSVVCFSTTGSRITRKKADCQFVARLCQNARLLLPGQQIRRLSGGFAAWEAAFAGPPAEIAAAGASVATYEVVGKRGAVLRSGVEMDTPCVGELPCGSTVSVDEDAAATTSDGKARVRVVAPLVGWCSAKMLALT